MKTIRANKWGYLLGGLTVAMFVLAGLIPNGVKSLRTAGAETINSQLPMSAPVAVDLSQPLSLSRAFRAAAGRVMPSVVMIQTTTSSKQRLKKPSDQQIPEELLQNPLFRRFFEQMPDSPLSEEQGQRRGMGSGVIIDASGVVLTNNHVVAGGDQVLVRLHDGREFEATKVYADEVSDIAVVTISGAGPLPAVAIGDSDAMEIGDWVIAVGAPFGLQETVTAGIISAKSRGIGITEREEFLQTDAAINPGNSGGPLVNLEGKVVGINTAISSTSGGYQGIGFAVPINLAKWVADQLVSNGGVHRAFLGVGVQSLTSPVASRLGLSTLSGALVTDVRSDAPAAKSGIQAGDVIVEFDGRNVTSPRALQGIVERADAAVAHQVTVIRDGERITLEAHVGSLTAKAEGPGKVSDQQSRISTLGIEVTDMTTDVAKKLGYQDAAGVLVTSVESGSVADKAGVEAGMLIQKVGSSVVNSVADFQQRVQDSSLHDGILLLVRSPDGARFVVLKDK